MVPPTSPCNETKMEASPSATTTIAAVLESKQPKMIKSSSISSTMPDSKVTDRLHEKRRELQALKEILLKTHKKTSPTFVPAVDMTKSINDNNTTTATTTVKNEIQPPNVEKVIVVKTRTEDVNNNNYNNNRPKRRPLTRRELQQKQHLLRMRRRHAQKGTNVTLWDGVQMIVSEIVFACTPVGHYDDEDEEGLEEGVDGRDLLCSTVEKTANLACSGKEMRGDKDDEEEADDFNSIITKTKEVSVDFMPKFKRSTFLSKRSEDDSTMDVTNVDSITSDSLVKMLLDHQQQRKLARQALESTSDKIATNSYELSTNSIVTQSTDGSNKDDSNIQNENKTTPSVTLQPKTAGGTIDGNDHRMTELPVMSNCNNHKRGGLGNQSDPILLTESDNSVSLSSTKPVQRFYQGKATADAPLLLLSESIENMILQQSKENDYDNNNNNNNNDNNDIDKRKKSIIKKTSVEASERLVRLLSNESTLAVKLSQKGDALSFAAITKNMNNGVGARDDDDHHHDHDNDENDGPILIESDDGDYEEMEQKMLLQMRLAQLKKKHQSQRRLAKQQQQQQQSTTAAAAVAFVSDKSSSTGEEDRNHSNHSHMTRETTKRNNMTTTSSQEVVITDQCCDNEEQEEEERNVIDEDRDIPNAREEDHSILTMERRDDDTRNASINEEQREGVVAATTTTTTFTGKESTTTEVDVDDFEEDHLFPKSSNNPDRPLDAEELYHTKAYRSERRRKDLEEMKQILDATTFRHHPHRYGSKTNTAVVGSHDWYYGPRGTTATNNDILHRHNNIHLLNIGDNDSDLSSMHVYDLQRASNQSALQALRQRHLDVVRLQLLQE
ncbi:hypothetical protein IV203_018884 [Nitzschia inconspicua]|uniref:Uncharacterized protein n=1 Tax=Nitzschia inconspicua TaxID=303405 RepID=A0A9K3M497_9STRA|nr:hypothetical protein IV203_018884 [Nitzschia inconspicua]